MKNAYEPQDIEALLCAYDRVAACGAASEALTKALSLYEADIATPYEEIAACFEKMAEQSGVHPYTTGLLTFLGLWASSAPSASSLAACSLS